MAISLLENLLITVFKFTHILRHLFQCVVILPKVELHSNVCSSILKDDGLLRLIVRQ